MATLHSHPAGYDMANDLYTAYKQARASSPFTNARSAWQQARYNTTHDLPISPWDVYPGNSGGFAYQGKYVRFEIEYDQDSTRDDDMAGVLSEGPSSYQRPCDVSDVRSDGGLTGYDHVFEHPDRTEHPTYGAYILGYDTPKGWRLSDRIKHYRASGMSKQVAFELAIKYIKEEYITACEWAKGDRYYVGVIVKVYRNEEAYEEERDPLGEESLWGIDSGDSASDREYVLDAIRELLENAMPEEA